MFGIDDKILSSLILASDCNLEIFSISIEIFFDFSKSDLSFDLEMSFFSFSKLSFF